MRSAVFPNEAVVALAEKIAQITPGEISQSFFTNSGTEANEYAVQLARMFTGRFEIVALRHGYSGRSQLAQSLTAHGTWRKSLPVPAPGVVHAMNAYCYRCPLGKTYPSCEVACAKDVEAVIQTSTSGQIAGFLAEPIQGVGRIHYAAEGIFQDRFQDREGLWRAVYLRRSADRLGTHRQTLVWN